MKNTNYRRIRRRYASQESGGPRKEGRERKFFGPETHDTFFQPQPPLLRAPDPKQEEEKVQRAAEEKKEEEKISRAAEDGKEKEKEKEPEKRNPEEAKKEEEIRQAPEEKKEEEEEKDGKIQKKAHGDGASSGERTFRYLKSIDGKGRPLPENAQDFFSQRMGYDFARVRIHDDREAADSAKEVRAKAYARGPHIVFNEGQYDAESRSGKLLLAHELAHVIQQNAGQRLETDCGPGQESAGTRPRGPDQPNPEVPAPGSVQGPTGKDAETGRA